MTFIELERETVICKYCHKAIYPWQRWTEILDGCAHSVCCWRDGFKEGKKLKRKR